MLCHLPAELLPEVQCAPCIQGAVSYQRSPAALNQLSRGSRPFAASVCQNQSQAAQASIITEPASPPDWPEASQEQDVPAEQYSHSGRITGPYVVTPKPVFAVVELGPTQFKVTPDDLVYSEKLKGVDVGDEVSLNRVLLLGNAKTTMIGRPCIPGAKVMAVVEILFTEACLPEPVADVSKHACMWKVIMLDKLSDLAGAISEWQGAHF